NLSISETHPFSSLTINQFRFGFSRNAGQGVAGGTHTDQDVGINSPSGTQEGLSQIEVLGAFELGNSSNDRGKTANNNFYLSDVMFLSRGKHDFRVGAEIFRNQFNQLTDNTAGVLITLSFPDFLLGLPAGPAGAVGNGTSLSSIYASGVVAGIPHVGQRASAGHFFILDDWKATRTLTLNLGVRVEVNGQQSEVGGRQSNFFPKFYVAPPVGGFTSPATSGFVLPGNFSGNAPEGFPRENSTLLNHPIPDLPPTASFPNFVGNMLPGPPFIGNAFLRSASITDPDFKESTVQHFDLDLQYQHKTYVFSLAYSGAKGTHLALGQDNNQP